MKKLRIPLSVTYNVTLANFKETIKKHWYIPNNNLNCREIFEAPPIIAFRKDHFLDQGTNII